MCSLENLNLVKVALITQKVTLLLELKCVQVWQFKIEHGSTRKWPMTSDDVEYVICTKLGIIITNIRLYLKWTNKYFKCN